MAPRFVEGAGGVPIATWELGGTGPPLLVAHATGFHALCMRAMARGLAEEHRVVALDLRGHGHSGTPPLDPEEDGRAPSMAWGTFAEDVLAVVDALGLEGAAAFGHSCGGAVVLLAEQRRPGTFTGIFTYEPVVTRPDWSAIAQERAGRLAEGARRRRQVFESRDAALQHYRSRPPLSSLSDDVLADYVEHGFADQPDGSVRLRCDPQAEAATYSMAPHTGVWEHLPEVSCPTTFACGGPGTTFGVDAMADFAARAQHGRVEEHGHLGHFGPLEQPDEMAEAVLRAISLP